MNKTATVEIRPWEQPFWRPARGKTAVFFYLLLIHILAVVGLILFPLPNMRTLGLAILLTALGGFGTTIGYHRMLAHRTVKVNKIIEHMLIFWAMFNGSGAPASWVAYHRLHHARADTPEDISSPKQGGFWWAHLRWLVEAILLCHTVSAEASPEIEQVPENRLARLQVGLLFGSELSTNQVATRVEGLDAFPPPVIPA